MMQGPRIVWPPEEGYFRLRLVRGGWSVPAQISYDVETGWRATIDGAEREPNRDPALATDVPRVWHYGRFIPEHEYEQLVALKAWAIEHSPRHPCVNPLKPIDRMMLDPIILAPRYP
jgi:hypothetical protein